MFSNIKRVDIEFHSKCNRECEWCPNKFIDRKSEDNFLDIKLYEKLLTDLYQNGFGSNGKKRSKDFGATISFLGYQEPFLAIDKFNEYLSIAKKIFQNNNIKYVLHSNGDLITEDNLLNLKINELNIMDYDCKGKEYWLNWLKEKKCSLISIKGNKLSAIHNSINLVQIFLDWPKNSQIEDRGGSLNKTNTDQNLFWKNNLSLRKDPCYESLYYLNIYYDGSVMPCCHLRPDNINHKKFIMGNLNNSSITQIYNSDKFKQFKENALKCLFPEECQRCHKYRLDLIQTETESKNIVNVENNDSKKRENIFRINKRWSEIQNQTWEKMQKYYNRIDINGKKYPTSFYSVKKLLFDVEMVKNLYNIYNYNLEKLKNVYEYKYVTLTNSVLVDHHNGIGFDNFSFTADSLAKEFYNNKGFFQPFLAYKYYKPGGWAICAGRHRLIALQLLHFNKIKHNISVLCFLLDEELQENLNVKIKFPKNLFPLIEDLNIYCEECDKDNYYLTLTNYVDNWICLKILEREMDFIIEYHYNDLINNNIYPSTIINKIEEEL